MRGIFLLLLILSACGGQASDGKKWMEGEGKLKVIATTAMIDDLVQAVGKERVAVYTLIDRGLDPHSYQLVKGDDEKLGKADLIFYNGLGLEHGASLHYYLSNSQNAVNLGAAIYKAHPEKVLKVGLQADPHIWMDAELFSEAIPAIVQALSEKDPLHAEEFASQGAMLKKELIELDQKIRGILAKVPSEKRYLVTSHDAFNYFTRAYLSEPGESEKEWSERFKAPEGLAPDSQISSADIQEILDHVMQYKITVIFPESNVSQDSIRKIVDATREKGVDLKISGDPMFGDSMAKKGEQGDTFKSMLLHNASVLERHWSKAP